MHGLGCGQASASARRSHLARFSYRVSSFRSQGLASASAASAAFSKYVAGDFWRHSLITAAASARVAQVRVAEAPGAAEYRSQAFTAGLVHDVGKLLIDAVCVRHGRRLDPGASGAAHNVGELLIRDDHEDVGASDALLAIIFFHPAMP